MSAIVDKPPHHPVAGVVRPALGRALIDTAVAFGLLGWLYAAVIAVFDPDSLSLILLSWLPIRRDTLGVFCFALSGCAYFFRQLSHPSAAMTDVSDGSAEVAVLRTIFSYSSLLLLYLMANSITHPATMHLPLTHFLRFPTEGQVLVAALFCSVASFFILRTRSHMRVAGGMNR
jgi:hypothetical protein